MGENEILLAQGNPFLDLNNSKTFFRSKILNNYLNTELSPLSCFILPLKGEGLGVKDLQLGQKVFNTLT